MELQGEWGIGEAREGEGEAVPGHLAEDGVVGAARRPLHAVVGRPSRELHCSDHRNTYQRPT